MGQKSLRERAVVLDSLLRKYEGTIREAALLRVAVQPLLTLALANQPVKPQSLGNFPGNRLFYEDALANLHDLADAYAKFSIEASGGPPPALQAFPSANGFSPLTGEPSHGSKDTR